MKKLLIATLLAGTALSAQAENFYVQGDLGYSIVDSEINNTNAVEDKVFTQRIGVGYDLGNVRFALDYTNFNKAKDNEKPAPDYSDGSLKIKSVGVSAIYDFHKFTTFVPYIGVRASYNHTNTTLRTPSYHYVKKENRPGLGVLAGVQRKLTNRLDLNLGAEYNRIGNDVYNLGASAGLRFNF